MSIRKIIWLFFLLLLAIFSYLREVLFISINAVIAGENFFYAKATRIEFFLQKAPSELVQYKYIMTVGFTVLFAALTIIGLKLSFKSKLPFYLATCIYLLCSVVAAFVISFSLITNSFDSVYSFLRLIIEYIHNPLVYILLSAAYLGTRFQKLSA